MCSVNSVVFSGGYKPLSEADLWRFESWLGHRLPEMYRTFLFEVNGGFPHKHELPECYIQIFYAITSANKNMSLQVAIEKMEHDLPKEIIPIGLAGNGDRICLSLVNEAIYLWEHDREYKPRVPQVHHMMMLAPNIYQLLDNLKGDESPVLDDEISNLGRWGDVDLLDDYLERGNDINAISTKGGTLVKYAAFVGHVDFIKKCKERGATLENKGLLHAAAFTMNYDLVQYLLEQGLNPNEKDELGMNPLDKVPPPGLGPAAQLLRKEGGVKSR